MSRPLRISEQCLKVLESNKERCPRNTLIIKAQPQCIEQGIDQEQRIYQECWKQKNENMCWERFSASALHNYFPSKRQIGFRKYRDDVVNNGYVDIVITC